MLRAAITIALLLLLSGTPSRAQQDTCLRRTLLVSVVNNKGEPLSGLTTNNFKGTFRGKQVRIVSVEDKAVIPRVVVLLDKSGSMGAAGDAYWNFATALAANPAIAFHERTPMALVTFSDQAEVAVPFGQPRKTIIDAIAGLRRQGAKGRTALFGAILKAVELLRPGQPGDVIYLISDGGENAGRIGYGEVERTLMESGARLFAALVYREEPKGTPEELEVPDNIRDLIRASGGSLISNTTDSPGIRGTVVTKDAISAPVNNLYHEMWELQELEVELAIEVDKPREWKLELVRSPGFDATWSQAHYPRKLLPCAPEK